MQLWFWLWLGLVLKLPVLWLCWYVYKVINNTPEHALGDDDDGQTVAAVYGQGPRRRGPKGGPGFSARSARRKDPGHVEADKKSSGIRAN